MILVLVAVFLLICSGIVRFLQYDPNTVSYVPQSDPLTLEDWYDF